MYRAGLSTVSGGGSVSDTSSIYHARRMHDTTQNELGVPLGKNCLCNLAFFDHNLLNVPHGSVNHIAHINHNAVMVAHRNHNILKVAERNHNIVIVAQRIPKMVICLVKRTQS